ncbi:MAG: hypothetical protein R3300_22505 [Candidatus Promineifilaceae bacterium]|nr:hypothetical protein [Candidatus Promineifilaceae bacterium]
MNDINEATAGQGRSFPWWVVGALMVLGGLLAVILSSGAGREALSVVAAGLPLTLFIGVVSSAPALLIGALVGRGCRSDKALWRNLGHFYLVVVGGIPTIITILVVFLLLVPAVSELLGLAQNAVSVRVRGVLALALAYSAILGDVFRLAQAHPSRGHDGFARLGGQTGLAVGIALLGLLKDSSLLSLLAVREVTQWARLHAGSTFDFRESYLAAIFLYLALTIPLRIVLYYAERRGTTEPA